MNLQGTILTRLPYSELRAICDGPPTVLRNALDCQWNVWRDRAYGEWGYPYEFFDLARTFTPQISPQEYLPYRNISGLQRYLEIGAYFLGPQPENQVRVSEDGQVSGVYEEKVFSRRREDKENLVSPARRVKEILQQLRDNPGEATLFVESLNELNYLIVQGSVEALEATLQYHPGLRIGVLYAVLASGRSDFFDRTIGYFLLFPEGFSLERTIPSQPFQVVDPEWWNFDSLDPFPLVDLSLYPQFRFFQFSEQTALVSSAIQGGNLKMVDFLRSLFNRRTLSAELFLSVLLNVRRNPLFSYQVLQRFRFSSSSQPWSGQTENVDIFLYLSTLSLRSFSQPQPVNPQAFRPFRINLASFFSGGNGNIDFLLAFQALWPLYPQREREIVLSQLVAISTKLLPLSREIYQSLF